MDRVERARCALTRVVGILEAVLEEEPAAVDVQRVDALAHVDRPDHERVAGVGLRQRRERVAVGIRAEEQRGVAVVREPVGPWLCTEVERGVDHGIVVDLPQRHLAEAAVDEAGGELRPRVVGVLIGVDVHDRAGVDLGSRLRIVVGGALRLDDQLADEAVAPVVDAVDVRVEEDVVELDVRVPAVLDELHAGVLTRGVRVLERLGQRDRLRRGVDRGDLTDLDVLGRQARCDPLAGLELRHAREAERRIAHRRVLRDLRVLSLERADRSARTTCR